MKKLVILIFLLFVCMNSTKSEVDVGYENQDIPFVDVTPASLHVLMNDTNNINNALLFYQNLTLCPEGYILKISAGLWICGTDSTGGTGIVKAGGGWYLYNDTLYIYLNETLLNITISHLINTSAFFIDTNATTECNLGELLDGSGKCVNYNNTIDQKLASVRYNATNITTYSGTYLEGNLSSLGIARDGNVYNVSESVGADPLTIIVNFTGVFNFDFVDMRYLYMGGLGHEIEVGLWDYDTGEYEEEYIEITDTPNFEYSFIHVRYPSSHTEQVTGNVSLRFRHEQNGVPTHIFNIDYLVLIEGISTGTNIDHDGLSGRDSPETNHPVYDKRINRLNETHNITDDPLTLINGNLSIPQADTDTDGYLSSIDWSNFQTTYDLRIQQAVAPLTIGGDPQEIRLTYDGTDFNLAGIGQLTITDTGIQKTVLNLLNDTNTNLTSGNFSEWIQVKENVTITDVGSGLSIPYSLTQNYVYGAYSSGITFPFDTTQDFRVFNFDGGQDFTGLLFDLSERMSKFQLQGNNRTTINHNTGDINSSGHMHANDYYSGDNTQGDELNNTLWVCSIPNGVRCDNWVQVTWKDGLKVSP